jgi:hypothetical protein
MRGQQMLLVLWLAALGASEGRAADYSVKAIQSENYQPPSWLPSFSVVGTLAPNWTDNAFFSAFDRRSDWFLNSDISLRLDGRLAPDLTYRFYVRSELDAFSKEKDADASMALWGARLTQDIAGWKASAIFENRYAFGGIYNEQLFTAYDVKGALSRDFVVNTAYNVIIFSPFMQARYRFSDQAFAEYFRLDLALGIEARLNERWSIVSSPFFEAYWFTNGVNSGRADQIYSVSLGVKYNFTPSVALTTSVAFEERFSNVAIRRYQSIDVGPRLNFAF